MDMYMICTDVFVVIHFNFDRQKQVLQLFRFFQLFIFYCWFQSLFSFAVRLLTHLQIQTYHPYSEVINTNACCKHFVLKMQNILLVLQILNSIQNSCFASELKNWVIGLNGTFDQVLWKQIYNRFFAIKENFLIIWLVKRYIVQFIYIIYNQHIRHYGNCALRIDKSFKWSRFDIGTQKWSLMKINSYIYR